MRLPRFRFSVRGLMVLVAVVAAGLGGCVLYGRSREYRKRAELFSMKEWSAAAEKKFEDGLLKIDREITPGYVHLINQQKYIYRTYGKLNGEDKFSKQQESLLRDLEESLKRRIESATRHKENAARAGAMVDYYARLRDKYARAAARPWLGVSDDPPPPDVEARALYRFERKEYGRALEDFEELLKRDPDDAWVFNYRAWIWATCPDPGHRDGRRAVESALRACELTKWTDPEVLATLAAAYAEAGDFDAAVRWQREALDRTPPNSPTVPPFRERLALYRRGRPFRDAGK